MFTFYCHMTTQHRATVPSYDVNKHKNNNAEKKNINKHLTLKEIEREREREIQREIQREIERERENGEISLKRWHAVNAAAPRRPSNLGAHPTSCSHFNLANDAHFMSYNVILKLT